MSRREDMIKTIKEGNSVILYDGKGGFKLYKLANLEELPSDAELALGNAHEEEKALEAIKKQVAELEEAKKRLEESQKKAAKAEEPVKAEKKAEPKAEAKPEAKPVAKDEAKASE